MSSSCPVLLDFGFFFLALLVFFSLLLPFLVGPHLVSLFFLCPKIHKRDTHMALTSALLNLMCFLIYRACRSMSC